MRRDARRTLLVHTSVRAHANGTRKRTCRMTKTRRRVGARAFRVNGRRGMARTEPHKRVRGRARGRLPINTRVSPRSGRSRVSASRQRETLRERWSPGRSPLSRTCTSRKYPTARSRRSWATAPDWSKANRIAFSTSSAIAGPSISRGCANAIIPRRVWLRFLAASCRVDRGQARRSIHRAKMQVSKLRDQKSVTASAVGPRSTRAARVIRDAGISRQDEPRPAALHIVASRDHDTGTPMASRLRRTRRVAPLRIERALANEPSRPRSRGRAARVSAEPPRVERQRAKVPQRRVWSSAARRRRRADRFGSGTRASHSHEPLMPPPCSRIGSTTRPSAT